VGSHMLGSNPPLLHSLAVGPVCLGVLELAYFCFLPAPHSVTSGRGSLKQAWKYLHYWAWLSCVISATQEAEVGGSWFQGQRGLHREALSQNKNCKRTGGTAQWESSC
jgi:hypothetical protein